MILEFWSPPKKRFRTIRNAAEGSNPAYQLIWCKYPIIYRVFYIPGGARFLPSTVFSPEVVNLVEAKGLDAAMIYRNPLKKICGHLNLLKKK